MLIVVGTNHKYSPIELRERISLSKRRLKEALDFFKKGLSLKSAVILSTCNRVEFYVNVEDVEKGISQIENFISQYYEIDKQKLSSYFYRYINDEALKHLLLVSCGLDSLVLGETQVLGQVKDALLESEGAGLEDKVLKRIFYTAISFTKRMHTQTKIAEGKVSVGSVAIDFIKEKVGTLHNKNILIVGIGKVTELLISYLKEESSNVIFLSNRTFDKAKELAEKINAQAVRLDELGQSIKKADILIAASASPHFIVKKETLNELINPKLLIIDLSLPRNVDPKVKEVKGVDLYCLEDLEVVIKRNIERKAKEAEKIKLIIDTKIQTLWRKFTELEPEKALLH